MSKKSPAAYTDLRVANAMLDAAEESLASQETAMSDLRDQLRRLCEEWKRQAAELESHWAPRQAKLLRECAHDLRALLDRYPDGARCACGAFSYQQPEGGPCMACAFDAPASPSPAPPADLSTAAPTEGSTHGSPSKVHSERNHGSRLVEGGGVDDDLRPVDPGRPAVPQGDAERQDHDADRQPRGAGSVQAGNVVLRGLHGAPEVAALVRQAEENVRPLVEAEREAARAPLPPHRLGAPPAPPEDLEERWCDTHGAHDEPDGCPACPASPPAREECGEIEWPTGLRCSMLRGHLGAHWARLSSRHWMTWGEDFIYVHTDPASPAPPVTRSEEAQTSRSLVAEPQPPAKGSDAGCDGSRAPKEQ